MMELENYREDGEGRALYWGEYRWTHETLADIQPGERLPQHTLVCFLSGSNFLPTHFDLRKVDRNPLDGVPYPGKSSHIAFTYERDTTYEAILDRKPKRGESVSYATVGQLAEIGFVAFYAPLPNTPLHIRLVHQAHLQDPQRLDVPFRSRKKLADLLNTRAGV